MQTLLYDVFIELGSSLRNTRLETDIYVKYNNNINYNIKLSEQIRIGHYRYFWFGHTML